MISYVESTSKIYELTIRGKSGLDLGIKEDE